MRSTLMKASLGSETVPIWRMRQIGTDDMVTLLNEIDKLSAYAERREITRADIDLMCVKTIEANAFDLTKYSG